MRLRYFSYQPISDHCRHPSASPPNSQYLESGVAGVHGYNAKANAPAGPAGPERNPKPQHYRLPTVADSTRGQPDVHGYNAKANAPAGPARQERNPKPQHHSLPTVAASITVHRHQPPTQGQFFGPTHSKGYANNNFSSLPTILPSHVQSFRVHLRACRSEQVLMELLSPCRC